jgi:hypothetical protein
MTGLGLLPLGVAGVGGGEPDPDVEGGLVGGAGGGQVARHDGEVAYPFVADGHVALGSMDVQCLCCARVPEANAARRPQAEQPAGQRWQAPGAAGWLGSTAGVTDDGRFVALAGFESEEAARLNSDRPEQTQCWMETSKLSSGDVSFRDSSDITADVNGDPGTAGFVQVMQGGGVDPERVRHRWLYSRR